MIAGLRTVLVGLLTCTAAYCLAAAYSLVTEANGCMDSSAFIVPPCKTLVRHLAVPGRHEAIVALACAAASILAAIAVPRIEGLVPAGALRQLGNWGVAAATAAILTLATRLVDPALHRLEGDLAPAAALLLAWFVGRQIAGIWARLGASMSEGTEHWRFPHHRLLTLALSGMVLTMGSAALVVHFARWRPTFRDVGAALYTLPPGPVAPHVTTLGVTVATGAYVLGAAALLVLAHYASLRPQRSAGPVAGEKGLATRWLLACSLLLAGLLVLAVIAPVASDGTAGLAGDLYGTIAGPGAKPNLASCRTDSRLCGHAPKKERGRAVLPYGKHKHAHTRGSNVGGAIARFALWLILVVPIVYFAWDRPAIRAGRERLLSLLAALWARFRDRSARLRAAVESRLPDGLADLGASTALARRGHTARLPAREQIIAYYLNAVGYSQRHGIARHPAQTPEEFELTLCRRLESGQGAWETLTADFIAARYSLDPMASDQPERARSAWHATRAAIRSATRTGRTER